MTATHQDSAGGTLWEGVDRLIDSAPGLRDLQSHGLHLLAARRWRELGRPIPSDLAIAELWGAFRTNEARALLKQIRDACDGPMILIKGLAAAAFYPDPSLRPFLDLDLLVGDPEKLQAILIESGLEPVRSKLHPETVHHLHPLQLPGSPLSVELHRHPKWVDGLTVPSFDDFVRGAEESLDVDGVLALRPAHHTLVLTAHLWAQDPLTKLLRVLDVAVTAEAADSRELARLVDDWGLVAHWRTTVRVVDALFRGAEPPFPLRTWARGIRRAGEPSVLSMHMGRCLAPFSVAPFPRAFPAFAAAVAGLVRPQPYETWSSKLARTARQLHDPSMRRSEHARAVAETLLEPRPAAEASPSLPDSASKIEPSLVVPQRASAVGTSEPQTPHPTATSAASFAWLAISTAWAALAILAVGLDVDELVRVPAVLGFVLLCPGLALVRALGLRSLGVQLSVAVALSMALVVLVPAALLYAGVWSPVAALAILISVTLGAAVTEVLLATGHERWRGFAR